MSLKLVETFLSIQGEGASAGRLAIFLRFGGCNLACKGFGVSAKSPKTGEILTGCDTIRAVFAEHFESREITSCEQILEIISNLSQNLHHKPIIVITGGEPLLHHKNQIFINLVQNLLELNFEVHFETNGTIFVDFDQFKLYKNCVFAVSVKLSQSGESERKRLNFRALQAIKDNAKFSFYKFVLNEEMIKNGSAKAEISQILSVCDNEIFCMPQGYDKISLEKNAPAVAKFCIDSGFHYAERVHIRLWGDKEGV